MPNPHESSRNVFAIDNADFRGAPATPQITDVNPLTVAMLQRVEDYPAVSVLCSTHPDPNVFVARLRGLAREVDRRLVGEFGGNDPFIDDRRARLAELIVDVQLPPGAHAVAVFVGPETEVVVWLPQPVIDRVIIDDTFATRDLVHCLLRSSRSLVLAINDRCSRLYGAIGVELHELRGGAFPLVRIESTEEGVRWERRRSHTDGRRDHELRRLVRDVDDALTPFLEHDHLPLLVVGSHLPVAAFRRRSAHRQLIRSVHTYAGRFGNIDHVTALIHPTLRDMIEARNAAAIAELRDATSGNRSAHGLDAVWSLANQGRGDLLVVEATYAVAARVDPVSRRLSVADDPTAPGVVDDVVDELIEAVLRYRGRVAIVDEGALAPEVGRVGLVTRGPV